MHVCSKKWMSATPPALIPAVRRGREGLSPGARGKRVAKKKDVSIGAHSGNKHGR
jgi:hypothetical protein